LNFLSVQSRKQHDSRDVSELFSPHKTQPETIINIIQTVATMPQAGSQSI